MNASFLWPQTFQHEKYRVTKNVCTEKNLNTPATIMVLSSSQLGLQF